MGVQENDSDFVEHGPCACGSSDANALYSNGWRHCFACEANTPPDGDVAPRKETRMKHGLIPASEITMQSLGKRRLTDVTCEKFGYGVSRFKGQPVQVANYKDENGNVVAQKVRFPDKEFVALGDLKAALPLYGQWLWASGGKRVVVTEGEIDCLSVSQIQNNSWPVVSLPTGAAGAKKAIGRAIGWLESFDEVVLMFDQDEPGRKATEECVGLFTPGKCKVAVLPLKDASACLTAGRPKDVLSAMWGAKVFRPDGVVSLMDIREAVLSPVQWGAPWPWETLTKLTYGRRGGEVYLFGAGVGIGKTDVFTQVIAQTIMPISEGGLNEKVGVFYLEQPNTETGKRIAGKVAGKMFHVPDGAWTQDELITAIDKIGDDKVYLYNHFGSTEWTEIKARIQYLAVHLGVKHIFLDHLTALAAHADDERRFLDGLMEEIASLCQQLGITMYVVSHLTTPDGKPHEEGGRVFEKHFTGSRAIARWAHFMFALERDKQAADPTLRCTTTFRVLKDRYTGKATGETFGLRYDQTTGRLDECSLAFGDETQTQPHGGGDY